MSANRLQKSSKWNGAVAADLYKAAVLKSLRQAFPRLRRFNLLKDNDPAGFKSRKGRAAKRAAKITTFHILKRSPDFSIMDYYIWRAVTVKMRIQERKFPRPRRETRAAYIARLRRAAFSLPRAAVTKAVDSMRKRCRLIYEARGGHIEE